MSPTLRRARVLAALRELDVAIDFGWRPFAAFCGRPYDQAIDDLLNPDYAVMARERIADDAPLLNAEVA